MEQFYDIEKVCKCGAPFTWTAGEQRFMNQLLEEGKLDKVDEETGEVLEKGQVTAPVRCKECRDKKKQRFAGRN